MSCLMLQRRSNVDKTEESGDLRVISRVCPDPICRRDVLKYHFRETFKNQKTRLTIRGQKEAKHKEMKQGS